MAKSFGEIMRDIGRALGFGGGSRDGSASSAGGTVRSIGADIARARQSMLGGGDREGRSDRDGPATPTEPVVAPPATETPVAPPVVETPTPPPAPTPVNPSDMTSTGASEDLALESAKQGLASTILTSGQGLVEEEEGLLRDRRRLGMLAPRRSLTGGGLIQ